MQVVVSGEPCSQSVNQSVSQCKHSIVRCVGAALNDFSDCSGSQSNGFLIDLPYRHPLLVKGPSRRYFNIALTNHPKTSFVRVSNFFFRSRTHLTSDAINLKSRDNTAALRVHLWLLYKTHTTDNKPHIFRAF